MTDCGYPSDTEPIETPEIGPRDPEVYVPSDEPVGEPVDPPVYTPSDVPIESPGGEPLPDEGERSPFHQPPVNPGDLPPIPQ